MKALAAARNAIRDALRGAQSGLDTIRTRITELQSERHRIETAPRDRASVEKLVDGMIADAQAREAFSLGALWSVYAKPHEALGNFNASAIGWNIPGAISRLAICSPSSPHGMRPA